MDNSSVYPNDKNKNLYMLVIEHCTVAHTIFCCKIWQVGLLVLNIYIQIEKDNIKGRTIIPRLNSIPIHPSKLGWERRQNEAAQIIINTTFKIYIVCNYIILNINYPKSWQSTSFKTVLFFLLLPSIFNIYVTVLHCGVHLSFFHLYWWSDQNLRNILVLHLYINKQCLV